MAGGIDWFRWHHGTVTDQKFPLVARRAGASVAEVIAVWACLLESASMNEAERGMLSSEPDFEAMDCALGLADGKARAIFEAMQQRALVDESLQIAAWPKRQPKRERQDDNSTERSRAFRQKQRHATPETGNATPRNATGHTETPREEKSREEELSDEAKASSSSPVATKGRPQVPCQYQAIVDAYHEALPMLPKVRLMDDKRKAAMRKLWGWVLSSTKGDGSRRATTGDEAVAWLRDYFGRAAANAWLIGQEPSRSHPGWKADFDFLLTDRGLKAVIERTEVAA